MWTTLALVGALTALPGQPAELTLTNVRDTYGVLGTVRPDRKLLPGDSYFLAFTIEGVTVDPAGKVQYSTTLEVADKAGKVLFRQMPRDLETVNALGGSVVPAFVQVNVGLDQAPGEYRLIVTVTDRTSKKSASLERTVEVLPPGFGIVRLTTTSDPEGQVSEAVFGQGQSLWINFGVVGFKRNDQKQPHVSLAVRVLDEGGKPTLARPFTGEVKELPATSQAIPAQFHLSLNRTGKFTVEVTATCQVTGKKATLAFPLIVDKTD